MLRFLIWLNFKYNITARPTGHQIKFRIKSYYLGVHLQSPLKAEFSPVHSIYASVTIVLETQYGREVLSKAPREAKNTIVDLNLYLPPCNENVSLCFLNLLIAISVALIVLWHKSCIHHESIFT